MKKFIPILIPVFLFCCVPIILLFSCVPQTHNDDKITETGTVVEPKMIGTCGFTVYIMKDKNTQNKFVVIDAVESLAMIEYVGDDPKTVNVELMVDSPSDWTAYKLTVNDSKYIVIDGIESLAISKYN